MHIKKYDSNNKSLTVNTSGDVVYLTSPVFDGLDFINHGMSTRLGGVSEGCCSSMNFAYNGIDLEENVAKNYEIFCNELGININKIARTKQVHGSNVEIIKKDHNYIDARKPGWDFDCTDGLITNVPGVSLFAFSADCALIMIVDPVNKAIGLCHSGWRGTVLKISHNVIDMMRENYGSKPENLLVTVGPSICQECFEVEWDMIEEARKGFKESDYSKIYYKKNETKYQFNLWEANNIVLLDKGVKKENIFLPNICTKCNPDTFFSHRNMGLNRGTLISFLSIKEDF